jgi:hypothetical protein
MLLLAKYVSSKIGFKTKLYAKISGYICEISPGVFALLIGSFCGY